MSMFCYQCQETVGCKGCTIRGVCGKAPETAGVQDLTIFALKGFALVAELAAAKGLYTDSDAELVQEALFGTITNANFDDERFNDLIRAIVARRDELKAQVGAPAGCEAYTDWKLGQPKPANLVGVLATEHEDVRSLRELLIYGLKGIAAYLHHAAVQGYKDQEVNAFLVKAMASTTRSLPVPEMIGLVLECGKQAVSTMALLDKANTETYGTPAAAEVTTGVGKRPGILISGHDLKDLIQLLDQTEGKGLDIYTHCEMLPAHGYPKLRAYKHLYGNYGGSWWHQGSEFDKFRGPILMTSNCIIPVKESYKDRIYTTGAAGYPEIPHIEADAKGKKDFSAVIARALKCQPPEELENGKVTTGFGHGQLTAVAGAVVDAVKSGAIKRFIVMAGCDGRQPARKYFTGVAEALPQDAVILTAGCAKFRYNKLNLGTIGGIPRVIDAGQCNDSYSLAVIALKLKEIFGAADVNDLPISFDVAWYEQKAVAVLLALLHLGFKNIRLGPTLPAFLSPAVAKVLVETFGIKGTDTVENDVAAMMAGN